VNSHFGVQRFEGAEEFTSELEDGKVTSGALVARWSQTPLTIFRVSWVGEPRAWHQDSRNREVQNSEKAESSLWGQHLIACRNSTFRHFRRQEVGSLFRDSQIVKCDIAWRKGGKYFGESVFRFLTVEESRNSEGEVAKSRNPKF
jgi:hypothetical protein